MTKKEILLVFIVALIVRIIYAWFFLEEDSLVLEDQMMYIQLAQQYPSSGFLGGSVERVLGYPLFIAAIYNIFGESNMAVVIVQAIIDSFTCIIVGLIAESVVSRGFLVAGLMSSLNLGMIILSGMILTDTLFLFLFSLFILIVVHYIKRPDSFKLFFIVFILCLSVLVRPVTYYLVFLLLPLLIIFLICKKVSFKRVAYSFLLYAIPIVIVFGSTHYRNYYEYNSFSLTSQGGGHAIGWVVPATYQYSGQGSYQEGQVLAKNYLKGAMNRDKFQISIDNSFENSNYEMKVAKELLMELGFLNILHAWSAGAVINLLTPSVAYSPIVRAMEHPSFYATPGNGAIEKLLNYVSNTTGLLYLLIIIFGTITSLLFLIISIFGLYRMIKSRWIDRRNSKEILLFLLFTVVYFIAITGPIVGVKYRLPIEPIMTVFLSYALVEFRKNLNSYHKCITSTS